MILYISVHLLILDTVKCEIINTLWKSAFITENMSPKNKNEIKKLQWKTEIDKLTLK